VLTASIVFGVARGDAAWSQSDVCGESAQIIAARGYSTSQLLFGPRQVQCGDVILAQCSVEHCDFVHETRVIDC